MGRLSGKKENARQYEVTGGWHDAGDYGRYTTAAATSALHT
ncbi:MAG: glycoside hydrolase family 9 protein [Anaerobutyricum hallii]